MSIYLRKNALPIFIEIIFVVSCFFVPQEYYIYSNLLFYLLLFADFYVKREFSFRKWVKNLKGGKTFWKQVIVTTVFFLIVFGLTTALESFFPNLDTGMIMLKRDTPARLIAFAISTMFLPAITEESFYRKSIISFRSKPALVLSAVFGMLLYAAEHSLKPWGIFLTAIWALPLMQKEKFILCPVCGNKTRVQIREDTELKNFPLFCPKCHKQTLINAKQLNITKAEVPDAKTQSR